MDDGDFTAKIQSVDQSKQYIVDLTTTPTCTCTELQEMRWPCPHVMAWDDQQGRDPDRHFHTCWRPSSLRALYTDRLPCFLSNDLQGSTSCWPPRAAVKKGRHRVVRIPSGGAPSRGRLVGEDEFLDDAGHLFARYPIDDDPDFRNVVPLEEAVARMVGRARGRNNKKRTGTTKCSVCRGVGHNKRTCPDTRRAGPNTNTHNAMEQPEPEVIPEEPMSIQEPEVRVEHEMYQQSIRNATPSAPPADLSQVPIPDYSESSDDDPEDGAEIYEGQICDSQDPQASEWMAHGFMDFAGVDPVEHWLEVASTANEEGSEVSS